MALTRITPMTWDSDLGVQAAYDYGNIEFAFDRLSKKENYLFQRVLLGTLCLCSFLSFRKGLNSYEITSIQHIPTILNRLMIKGVATGFVSFWSAKYIFLDRVTWYSDSETGATMRTIIHDSNPNSVYLKRFEQSRKTLPENPLFNLSIFERNEFSIEEMLKRDAKFPLEMKQRAENIIKLERESAQKMMMIAEQNYLQSKLQEDLKKQKVKKDSETKTL